MTNCERLNLKPCNTCRGGQGLLCYVEAYKMMINATGFDNQLKHVLDHPTNAIYFFTAIKTYYKQYMDRAEKLMVLL